MKRILIFVALLRTASTPAFAQCGLPELRDSWVKNWNDRNLDGVIKLYAPDATMLPSDGQRIIGRDNIRAFLKAAMDSGMIEGPVQSVAAACSQHIGYESGTFEETIGAEGKKRQGNYLVVVRKISGKWLIVQHASMESHTAARGGVAGTSAASDSVSEMARAGAAEHNGSSGQEGNLGLSMGVHGRQTGALEILSDTQGVDFGPYLQSVLQAVRKNWYDLIPQRAQMNKGKLAIELAITPEGKIAGMKLVATSGDVALDRAAWGGIVKCNPFPPLPSDFHGPYLAQRFRFYYNPGKDEFQ